MVASAGPRYGPPAWRTWSSSTTTLPRSWTSCALAVEHDDPAALDMGFHGPRPIPIIRPLPVRNAAYRHRPTSRPMLQRVSRRGADAADNPSREDQAWSRRSRISAAGPRRLTVEAFHETTAVEASRGGDPPARHPRVRAVAYLPLGVSRKGRPLYDGIAEVCVEDTAAMRALAGTPAMRRWRPTRPGSSTGRPWGSSSSRSTSSRAPPRRRPA